MPEEEALEDLCGPTPPILLVRHAHDDRGNDPDPGLTPRGRAEAEALAACLAGHAGRYAVVYCSPRRRARETADVLARALGAPTAVDPRLANVPSGVRGLLAIVGLARFARALATRDGVIVVTHAGPLRFLALCLDGLRRLPWLWRRVPPCGAVPCRSALSRPGMDVPLALYGLGIAVGLAATRGPSPGGSTWLSHALALAAYGAARRLARAGEFRRITGLLSGGALMSAPAAFGPSSRPNRKVTALNAHVYRAGSRLPALGPVPPHPNGVAGALAAALGLLGGALRCPSPTARAAAGVGMAASLAGLALTACRSGWTAGVTAALTLGSMRGRNALLRALGFSVAGVGGLLATGGRPSLGQPSLLSTASMATRWRRWRTVAGVLRRTPLVGVGLGRLPAACRAELGGDALKTPNSTPLQVWADAGLLGLISIAWGLARGVGVLRRAWASSRVAPPWFVEGLTSALVALVVHGAFEVDHAIVWRRGEGHGYLASPLPYVLLGALSGLADRLGTPAPSRRAAMPRRIIGGVRGLSRIRGARSAAPLVCRTGVASSAPYRPPALAAGASRWGSPNPEDTLRSASPFAPPLAGW